MSTNLQVTFMLADDRDCHALPELCGLQSLSPSVIPWEEIDTSGQTSIQGDDATIQICLELEAVRVL